MIARLVFALLGFLRLSVMGLSDTIRTSQATDIRTAIDLQSSAGKLKLYSGTRPAKNGTATTLLSTMILNKPSFTISSGVMTLIVSPAISDTNAANAGTATWARLTDGGDNFVADLLVTVTGGGGDVTIDNVSITAGGTVNLTGGTITIGNA